MHFACKKFVCAATAWLMLVSPVWGQAPTGGARFDISGFSVLGAPQIANEEFSKIVAPFIGRQKTPEDVQKARQALQQAYLDLGHCSTQVTVPRGEPDFGVITFRLVQSSTPISRDCAPTVVLDQKRAVPPVVVAPGEVATRPLAGFAAAPAESAVASAPPIEIARAAVKPLLDGTVVKPLQDRPAPAIATAPVPREAEPSRAEPKPLADVAQATIAAKPAPESKPVVVAVAPKPEPVPAPKAEDAPPQPVAVAKPAPEPKPAIVAIAPKPEPVPEPKPAVIAVAPKPEPVPAPKIEVAPPQPVAVAKPEPAPEPKPAVVAVAPKAEPEPKPAVVAVAPKPEPAPAPKIEGRLYKFKVPSKARRENNVGPPQLLNM